MKKTIFSLIFATCAAFSNSIQAEEVYYQQEDRGGSGNLNNTYK
ncbi:hypothetical protein [Acinetobacter baumannii]